MLENYDHHYCVNYCVISYRQPTAGIGLPIFGNIAGQSVPTVGNDAERTVTRQITQLISSVIQLARPLLSPLLGNS